VQQQRCLVLLCNITEMQQPEANPTQPPTQLLSTPHHHNKTSAYPKASGDQSLCGAMYTSNIFVRATGTTPSNDVVPTATTSQGMTTVATTQACDPDDAAFIAAQMKTSLQSRADVANATVIYQPPCQAEKAPAGSYIDANGVIHIKGYKATSLWKGGSGRRLLLDVVGINDEDDELLLRGPAGRRLLQQSDLWIKIYNMLSVIIVSVVSAWFCLVAPTASSQCLLPLPLASPYTNIHTCNSPS